MADDKKIRISAALDTSQIDSGIKALEDKFKNLQKLTNQKQGTAEAMKNDPVFGSATKKAYEDQQKASKDFYQTEYKARQDGLNKLFNTATSKIMEAMGGEVIAEEVHEDEIKVENIPF